ncbi:hypothetical protein [Streptomyces fructofermentans]|uniref:Uncharacterized protein n=1 Tax=Streptomyces fructofermentans TaxID=152141 RepID=A0A918NWF4_9ACTN|nr:hypothetical protein [Streptomyces fructofermentans]GGX99726.1 hypothetical protein GCM10010515_77230 [Streptomyces fructofermentans]
MRISTYWKAIVAGAVAGSGVLSTAAADGVITTGEVWLIVGAVVGGLGLTWAVPNKQTGSSSGRSGF